MIRRGRCERREVVMRRRNWVAPSVYLSVRDLGFDIVIGC